MNRELIVLGAVETQKEMLAKPSSKKETQFSEVLSTHNSHLSPCVLLVLNTWENQALLFQYLNFHLVGTLFEMLPTV